MEKIKKETFLTEALPIKALARSGCELNQVPLLPLRGRSEFAFGDILRPLLSRFLKLKKQVSCKKADFYGCQARIFKSKAGVFKQNVAKRRCLNARLLNGRGGKIYKWAGFMRWGLLSGGLMGLWFLSFGMPLSFADEESGFKFTAKGCLGNELVTPICEKYEDTGDTDSGGASTANGDSGSTGENGINASDEEGGAEKSSANCRTALDDAEICCDTPTTCLGGEALATLEQVNNVVTSVGPGLATMLQGFGKGGMGEMCKQMQLLAAGGGSLAVAAHGKCKLKISSCTSQCEQQIKTKCSEYNIAKTKCEDAMGRCSSPEDAPTPVAATELSETECKGTPPAYETTFEIARDPARQVLTLTGQKKECKKQAVKVKDWGDKMGQMANTALSAEMCKQQARILDEKELCKAKGGTMKDGECDIPETNEEKCEKAGREWKDGTCLPPVARITAQNQQVRHSQSSATLSEEPAPEKESTEGEGEGPDKTGGGGRDGGAGAPPPGISIPGGEDDPLTEDGTEDGGDSATGGSTQVRSGPFLGGSGGRYRGRGRNNKKGGGDDEEDGNLGMGGGGFSAYGGRGGGGGDEEDFASLKLSKKKLKEMEKKKGALRKTASEMGGAHQNIFERINRRFKSLCQKDLDCQ